LHPPDLFNIAGGRMFEVLQVDHSEISRPVISATADYLSELPALSKRR
jgi:hypothetical protein